MMKEYVIFSVGGAWYAFPILNIAFPIMSIGTGKAEKNVMQVQPLPRQGQFMKGLANVHGEICVVLSISAILGLDHGRDDFGIAEGIFFRHTNGYTYGFLLETVPDIISISTDDIEPVPHSLGEAGAHLLVGVYQRENGPLLGILNPALLVDVARA